MDEWLKDLRNVWVDMAVKGRVYPEGLGLPKHLQLTLP